jgi:hypothetical protein
MQYPLLRLGLNSRSLARAGVLLIISVSLLVSCSSAPDTVRTLTPSQMAVREAYQDQKPVVIHTSEEDPRPKWTRETSFEQDGKVYFSGGYLHGGDYSVTIRCANAEALKVVTQSISQFIRAEFSEYAHGTNDGSDGVNRYVTDGIAALVSNLHLQGIRQTQVYYEETFDSSANRPAYNAWVQLEISKADHSRAKADTLRSLRDRFEAAGDVEAKENAERLLQELKQGIIEEDLET